MIRETTDITDRKALTIFVRNLAHDLRANPEQWENATLPEYLLAIAAWTEDMDGYYANSGRQLPDTPSWSMLAEILAAAAIYE